MIGNTYKEQPGMTSEIANINMCGLTRACPLMSCFGISLQQIMPNPISLALFAEELCQNDIAYKHAHRKNNANTFTPFSFFVALSTFVPVLSLVLTFCLISSGQLPENFSNTAFSLHD